MSARSAVWARSLAVVLLALAAACSKPTGLVIHIDSDITGGYASLNSMRLTLRYGDSSSPIVDQISYVPGSAADPIPGNIPVYAADPEEMRTLDVLVEAGLGADGLPRADAATIAEHFVVRMRPHHLLRLDVHLDMECVNRMCPEGTTCGAGGACVSSMQGGCDFGTTCMEDVASIDVPVTPADGGPDAMTDADPPSDVADDVVSRDVPAMDAPRDVSVVDGPDDVAVDAPRDVPVDVARDVPVDVPTDTAPADVVCFGGAVPCGAGCAMLGIDHANCGACGHACAPVQTCSGGACIQLSCSATFVHCPGDLPGNCGGAPATTTTCALACSTASACTAGYTCQAAYTRDYACCRTNSPPCTGSEFAIGSLCCDGQ